MTVDVYELRLSDAPEERWYGVRVNGRDRNAGWADPEAARRWGEFVEAEELGRRGASVTEIKEKTTIREERRPDDDENEPVQLPEEPADPTKPVEPVPNPGQDPNGPGESENAPGKNKPEPKDTPDR